MRTKLADFLRESDTDPFLLAGPPAPREGWIYRDFRPMPRALWRQLLTMLGNANYVPVVEMTHVVSPTARCRAQLWISPAGQGVWRDILAKAAR